jgi:alpha-amylase
MTTHRAATAVLLALASHLAACRARPPRPEAVGPAREAQPAGINGTMMQFFEWHLPDDGTLWRKVRLEAKGLAELGITALWLPPAYKGNGSNDVGYTAYDWYDLGEFDQKGATRTKYGTRQEYLDAIQEAHRHGIHVYADVVFNHKGRADATEVVKAVRVDPSDRNREQGQDVEIEAWTRFDFPGRGTRYSTFRWRWYHFDGVDWDQRSRTKAIFKFRGEHKGWDPHVDLENGNYDYLMYADVDFQHPDVVAELTAWGRWCLAETKVDGFRLDAVKHIDHAFFTRWLGTLRQETGRELFAVGEYLHHDVGPLHAYIANSQGCMSLFDFALRNRLREASRASGAYDMRRLLDATLMKDQPVLAVTFVENHDTQPGREGDHAVLRWFKPLAYTFILTRGQGYPCVFYGDFCGMPSQNVAALERELGTILAARKARAYGPQHDYLDHPDVIGWTREGDAAHPGSGLAALITDGPGGQKRMFVGTRHAGRLFRDSSGNSPDDVRIDAQGWGTFAVKDGSWAIWVPREAH